MHAACNPDFRCFEGVVTARPGSGEGQDEDESGYYVVVPRQLRKPLRAKADPLRGPSSNPPATRTFGPYRSLHEARFIRISAHALGLLDLDPAP